MTAIGGNVEEDMNHPFGGKENRQTYTFVSIIVIKLKIQIAIAYIGSGADFYCVAD
jgi:hypothetical protein